MFYLLGTWHHIVVIGLGCYWVIEQKPPILVESQIQAGASVTLSKGSSITLDWQSMGRAVCDQTSVSHGHVLTALSPLLSSRVS